MAGTLERELKVEVDESFHVPDLTAAVGVSIVSLPEVTLEATYYDTDGYDLGRWGVTLRHRISSAGPSAWTLKLPAEPDPDPAGPPVGLHRSEIDFEGAAGTIPADAVAPLATYVRDAQLRPVAILDTRRRRHLLMSTTDTLAELDDDTVEFRIPDGRSGTFRELEIELSETGPVGMLRRIDEVLRRAGVRPTDPRPKVLRALGADPVPVLPPVALVPAGAAPTIELVTGMLAAGTRALLLDDPRVRIGDDAEALRRFGEAVLRLSSRTEDLHRVLEPEWSGPVLAALADLDRHLTDLLDVDVVVARLAVGASRLPAEDQNAAAELAELLASGRETHLQSLRKHMDTGEYLALVDRLVAAAWDPPVRRAAAPTTRRALQRRLEALALAAADAAEESDHPSRRQRRAAPGVDLAPLADATRHARVALDTALPADGRRAQRLRAALERLDGLMQELRGATLARRWLRDVGSGLDGRLALAAGQLLAGETGRANRARRHWPRAWKDVGREASKWPGPK